ncbi:MAG: N-acetyltransferase family protein [Actinomycetota bacterium]
MNDPYTIREARAEDAGELAALWREFGRDYADLDPVQFREPDEEGLEEWMEARIDQERDLDALWLVAESTGRLVGFAQGQIWRPADDAERQLMTDVGETVLKVDSVLVAGNWRRRGVATSLMRAVEAWSIDRGATRAVVVASSDSESALPFYERRMGYGRTSVGFWKRL